MNRLQLKNHVLVCLYDIPPRCSERSRTFHIMLDVQGAAEWQISQRPQPREVLVTMKSHPALGQVLPDCGSSLTNSPSTIIQMNSPSYTSATSCHKLSPS